MRLDSAIGRDSGWPHERKVLRALARRVVEPSKDPTVAKPRRRSAASDDWPMTALTPRERDVLQLMAEGLSNRAIAERMGIV